MATYKNLRKVLSLPTLSASPSSGVNGEMYFNTTDSALNIYDGAWKKATQSELPGPDWTATTQQAKIQASDPTAGDGFAVKVAIDGDTMVAGNTGDDTEGNATGATYVFTRSGTSWSQQAKLVASDPNDLAFFGAEVEISGDTLVAGAKWNDGGGSDAGAAYVFTRSGTSWSQQAKIVSSDIQAGDYFGEYVAIDGDTIVVGAIGEDTGGYGAGAAYVFTRSGTTWSQQAKIQSSDIAASDMFGTGVSIDGDTVVVGAYMEADGQGAAYVFTRSGTSWSQQAKLVASDGSAGERFGNTVSISSDSVVVGSYYDYDGGANAGSAYVFTRSGTTWSQQAKIQSSDIAAGDQFGKSVAIDGDTVVVGVDYQDTGGANAGAAYVFTRSGTTWTQAKKLVASDAQANDLLGFSVDISGNTVVAGARGEDTGASGAGTAYTFVAG